MSARYSRQAGYTIARRQTRRPATRTVQRQVKFGPTTAKYMGLAILGILALVMVTRASTSATESYSQNKIRTETSKVNAEVDNLRLEARREQALENVRKSQLTQQMVENGQVNYIEKGDVAGASTTQP